jgi:hypothetical protein
MSSNSLEQLKAAGTTVVTDTGEFECEYLILTGTQLTDVTMVGHVTTW